MDPGGYTDEQYFNVKISFTAEDEKSAIEALNCYVTQYTPGELKEEAERKLKDTENTIYFRRFVVKKGLKDDF